MRQDLQHFVVNIRLRIILRLHQVRLSVQPLAQRRRVHQAAFVP